MALPHARIEALGRHLASAPAPEPLTADQAAKFGDDGFLVLRRAFDPSHVAALREIYAEAYAAHDYEASAVYDRPAGGGKGASIRYPEPGNYSMGSRLLARSPHVVPLCAGDPLVVGVVEQLLGGRARLSQFACYCRTPGALGTGASSQQTPGAGTHYDYKPWRPVGSFVQNWLFCVIPFVDYTNQSGPLLVVPGSHRLTSAVPSANGRTHAFRASCVPSASALSRGARLHDPELRAGDLLFMHGSTWHEAWPNASAHDRLGLYMKYHAVSAPPSVGPIIHPREALEHVAPEARHLFEHSLRGRYSAIVRHAAAVVGPSHVVDATSLVLEEPPELGSRVLVLKRKGSCVYELPGLDDVDELGQYSARQLLHLHYLDAGNVIKPATLEAEAVLALAAAAGDEAAWLLRRHPVVWMSWIADHHSRDHSHLRRVYGHRLSLRPAMEEDAAVAAPVPPPHGGGGGGGGSGDGDIEEVRWVDAATLGGAGMWRFGGEEVRWVNAWQRSEGIDGAKVVRGFGFMHGRYNRLLQGTYNGAGNATHTTHYTVGEFDRATGALLPPPPK